MPEEILDIRPKEFIDFLTLNDIDHKIPNVNEIESAEVVFEPVEHILNYEQFRPLRNLNGVKVILRKRDISTVLSRLEPETTPTESYKILESLTSQNKKVILVPGSPVDYDILKIEEILRLLGKRVPPEIVAAQWIESFVYASISPAAKKIADLINADRNIYLITQNVSGHFKTLGCTGSNAFYLIENELEVLSSKIVRIRMMAKEMGRDLVRVTDVVRDANLIVYLGTALRGPIKEYPDHAKSAIVVHVSRGDKSFKKECKERGCDGEWRNLPSYAKIIDKIENIFESLDPQKILRNRPTA